MAKLQTRVNWKEDESINKGHCALVGWRCVCRHFHTLPRKIGVVVVAVRYNFEDKGV
ncbi:hypothetical protein QG37_04740 [Candidozyma auris]|uniref:Uncharacterized protein n=1 Tax=Candidozyma auris TaxID=498019 RepID=A0A0L0NWH9_CANAR|nr:hypothetical protein QG37_04740 [[Candida] auris]